MDPFSLTLGIVTLSGAAVKTSSAVFELIQETHGADEDLRSIQDQLGKLQQILNYIQSRSLDFESSPHPQQTIHAEAMSCHSILGDIDSIIHEYQGAIGAFKWAAKGKKRFLRQKQLLEDSIQRLDLITSHYTQSITKETFTMAREIKDDCGYIKTITGIIMDHMNWTVEALASSEVLPQSQFRRGLAEHGPSFSNAIISSFDSPEIECTDGVTGFSHGIFTSVTGDYSNDTGSYSSMNSSPSLSGSTLVGSSYVSTRCSNIHPQKRTLAQQEVCNSFVESVQAAVNHSKEQAPAVEHTAQLPLQVYTQGDVIRREFKSQVEDSIKSQHRTTTSSKGGCKTSSSSTCRRPGNLRDVGIISEFKCKVADLRRASAVS